MNKKRNMFPFLLIILLAFPLTAQEESVAEVMFLDGDVMVFRNGEELDWRDVDIGLMINDYDLIETGRDGTVELEVTTPSSYGTVIKLAENTAFYFDVSEVGSKKKTTFQMLTGSLTAKVQKLTGNGAVDVRTESAVMGVRGTEFVIQIAPEGSLLVTCSEGVVECEDAKTGTKATAVPGSAKDNEQAVIVRKDYDKTVEGFSVGAGDQDLYRAFWQNQREAVFKSGARTFIQYYANLYNDILPKFETAYTKLLEKSAAIEKYGKMGPGAPMGTMIEAKTNVSAPVFQMRSILPLFEHVFYSVQTLDRYHDQGIGQGSITNRLSSTSFFSSFKTKSAELKNKMGYVRYLFKLYLAIDKAASGGIPAGPSLMNDIFNSGNPLDGGGIPQGTVPQSSFGGPKTQ